MSEVATVETFPTLEQNAEGTGPATSSNGPAPETNNERRHRMRLEATARHAKLIRATIVDRNNDRDERQATGVMGREGYVAWTFERMEAIRNALHDSVVTLTLSRTGSTKRGTRVAVTGIASVYCGVNLETVAIKGEATVVDIADASTLEGATVSVRLARAENRKGEPLTTFTGTSQGVSSTGQRIGLKVRCQAGRFARVVASAL